MALTAATISKQVRRLGDPAIAEHSARFFKTGPGEYGEGDRFVGIRVPEQRRLVRTHRDTPLAEVEQLLHSPWHEIRLFALFLLVEQYARGDDFEDTLLIAERLLGDREDLIHKAVGWMLREVGKRDKASEAAFLASRYRRMPRTMLRYAIEQFPPTERRAYLDGRV